MTVENAEAEGGRYGGPLCQQVTFRKAELRDCPEFPGMDWLVVEGDAPCINMRIELAPVIYIRQPEYWTHHVIGCLDYGICLTAMKSYVYCKPVCQLSVGTKGIELVGTNQTVRIDICES